ncbi:MAG: hypothetical protein AAFQ94_22210 [Bacteroidota bacterium]
MKNQKIVVVILILGYLILVGALTSLIAFFRDPEQFFFNLAAAIMLSWIITIIIFYIWAMYYFHIHLAVEDKENEALLNNPDTVVELGDKLLKNPHHGETMGLPKGTIRGTIALSLLIAGLALLIASFEMNQTYSANALFVDNFEFIKTAFLMVIAFYFGTKSLSAISNRNSGIYRPGSTSFYKADDNQNINYSASNDSVDSFTGSRVEPTHATSSEIADPALVTGKSNATELKKMLNSDGSHTETSDTTNGKDFEDKDAVG